MKTLTRQFFWERVPMIKKAIASMTGLAFLWMTVFVPSARLFAYYAPDSYRGQAGVIYQYDKLGLSVKKGLDFKDGKQGDVTYFTANGKVDYVARMGTDGKEIIITDFDYDEQGRILKITDCTSGKYLQYGDIKNSRGENVGWAVLAEFDADNKKIGNYVYNDDGVLLKKELYSKIDSANAIRHNDEANINKQVGEANTKIAGLNNQKTTLQGEIDKLGTESENESSTQKNKRADLNSQMTALDTQIAGLQEKVKGLQSELDGAKNYVAQNTNDDGYVKTGEIIYDSGGKPSKEITFLELSDHHNAADTDDKTESWAYFGKEGRVSKEYNYDAQGKLTSSTEYKLNYTQVGHKDQRASWVRCEPGEDGGWLSRKLVYNINSDEVVDKDGWIWKKETVAEVTKYDESEKPSEITRNGVVVGSFKYENGKLTESTYTDVQGLVTTTKFDQYERASSSVTEGVKTQWLKLDKNTDGGAIQTMLINIKTETTFKYNDTSETKTISTPKGDVTVRAGGLESKSTVGHTWGDAKFTFTMKVCKKKIHGETSIHTDETTRTTEYFNNGQAKYMVNNTLKEDSKSKTDTTFNNKDKGVLGLIVAAIVVVAIVVAAVATGGTAIAALMTNGATWLSAASTVAASALTGGLVGGAAIATATGATLGSALFTSVLTSSLVSAVVGNIVSNSINGTNTIGGSGFWGGLKSGANIGAVSAVSTGVDVTRSMADTQSKPPAPTVSQPNYANRLYEQVAIRPPVEAPKNYAELTTGRR